MPDRPPAPDEDVLFFDDEPGGTDLIAVLGALVEGQASILAPVSARHEVRIVVVDDDPSVRAVTQLALQGVTVDGDALILIALSSAAEARAYLSEQPDVAVALLDVVMETEHAGLDLARWLRSEHPGSAVRIVLRTGQPGSAPEAQVTADLDIHDYLSKAETTARRLITCITGAVRAWRDVRTIREQRAAMQRALTAVSALFDAPSPETLPSTVVNELAALLAPRPVSALFACPPDIGGAAECDPVVVAGTRSFEMLRGLPLPQAISASQLPMILDQVPAGRVESFGLHLVYSFELHVPQRPVLVVEAPDVTPFERELVQLYCHSATLAMRNCRMWDVQRAWFRALEKFVPGALSNLVGLDDLRAVKPGDNATHAMTVCFVDIRGFTARTARVGANAAFRSLNVLFTELGEVVSAHGGIIDKYLGDGMLVLFPGRVTDAYRAAVEMQRRARTVVAPDGGERMQIGIGMHTGDVVVGAVGHPERMDISVVSPVVNLASRLQEMARGLSCDIVLTEELRTSLPPDMQAGCRPLLRHAIRGDIGERTLYEAFEAHEPARAAACRRSLIALHELTHEAAQGRWSTVAAQLPMLQDPDDPTVDQLLLHARQRVAEGG